MSDAPGRRAIPRLIDPGGGSSLPVADGTAGAAGQAEILCIVPLEAHTVALAAEHVLTVYRRHRAVMMGSPDWNERDRACFDALDRAVTAFWSREPESPR